MDKLFKTTYGDLRSLIDLLPDYIYFKDNQSRFIDANKATLRIMKCSSLEDCIGKTDFDFYPKRFAEKYFSDECEILRTGVPKLDMEEVTPDEQGNLGYYSTSKVPLKDSDGKIIGLVGIGRNITDRKKFQELMMQKEIEKVSRLSDIGTLATSVAHELRNPLEIIKLSTVCLKKEKSLENNKYLSDIEKKVWESNRIIDNLLNYSHIKSPSYELSNLTALVDECISTFPANFKDHQITIEKKYEAKELLVDIDPYQIKQVFINIFQNACQAISKKNGKIEVSIESRGNHVCVSFKDNGIGINENDLDKIFIPFYTSKSAGTGLGLSICNQLINLHNGKIEVSSKRGEGTTFRVILPLRRASSSSSN